MTAWQVSDGFSAVIQMLLKEPARKALLEMQTMQAEGEQECEKRVGDTMARVERERSAKSNIQLGHRGMQKKPKTCFLIFTAETPATNTKHNT